MKCAACGSASLVEGRMIDTTDGGTFAFQLSDVPAWKSIIGRGTRKVAAYGCVKCGHLQLAVDFSDEDRARHLQFEGEQPGVLDRIKADDEA